MQNITQNARIARELYDAEEGSIPNFSYLLLLFGQNQTFRIFLRITGITFSVAKWHCHLTDSLFSWKERHK